MKDIKIEMGKFPVDVDLIESAADIAEQITNDLDLWSIAEDQTIVQWGAIAEAVAENLKARVAALKT